MLTALGRVIRRMSADVSDALLGCLFGRRLRLCRKLKPPCLLTLNQACQENTRAIGKFECVMMYLRQVLVDLPEDRHPKVYCFRPPVKEAGRSAFHIFGKSKLSSGKNAHRLCGILRCGKPSCTGPEVDCPKLITDLRRPGFDVVVTNVAPRSGTRVM